MSINLLERHRSKFVLKPISITDLLLSLNIILLSFSKQVDLLYYIFNSLEFEFNMWSVNQNHLRFTNNNLTLQKLW